MENEHWNGAGSDRAAAVREPEADPAHTFGCLEERFSRSSTSSLLQAPNCKSGVCLPYGRRAIAPCTIPALNYPKTALSPPTKIRNLVTSKKVLP